ncbi:MAG: tRNA lysidine(34) synthetase TilS [Propionibacteriaceae bacterium]|jgi:tRNA(Ile)-lysidine synthase|nr:tRNA lysidine(34) synthetase TilS [Propionibacteriaceae bacterium]
MARKALTQTQLRLVQALEEVVPGVMAATGVQACRIGLSGGADSLALTAAFAWARDRRQGYPLANVVITARVVDHELQAGSGEVAAQAAQQAAALGITAEVVRISVDADQGIGIEAAARAARYQALREGEPTLIITGHTLDDQAETVLLGLARGSGTRSLSGMAAARDHVVRPFLTMRRADTEQACRDWGLVWWEDPTNRDPAYARSRLRRAMGLLDETLGPGLPEALARTADLCRQDADLLDSLALVGDPHLAPSLAIAPLAEMPPALRHRVILAWLRHHGSDPTRDHILAVDALITDWRGQKAIQVPGGTVIRKADQLHLSRMRG